MIKSFKNVIFDFGGVILNIDYNLTIKAFERLGIPDFKNIYSKFNQSRLFDKLETGEIEGKAFIAELKSSIPGGIAEKEITAAWNAMLLDLPEERISFLKALKKKKNIFLLSNTNEIHYKAFSEHIFTTHGIKDFSTLFHRAYYSHLIGMRKPHVETFQYVLRENDLEPAETVFVDDSLQHIEGAAKAGITAHHLQKDEKITDLTFL